MCMPHSFFLCSLDHMLYQLEGTEYWEIELFGLVAKSSYGLKNV